MVLAWLPKRGRRRQRDLAGERRPSLSRGWCGRRYGFTGTRQKRCETKPTGTGARSQRLSGRRCGRISGLRTRRQRMIAMVNSSSQSERKFLKIRDQVSEWCRAGGFEAQPLAAPNVYWALRVVRKAVIVAVSQPVATPDRIAIAGALELAEWHKAKIDALSEDERRELLWDLRLRLLTFDVDFVIARQLQSATISRQVFTDGLNRSAILAALRQVNAALLTYVACIERRAGAPPEEPEELTN
jgi:hypothetical protein